MFFNPKVTKFPNDTKAFTLVELLVVIVIIGILATLTTVTLTSVRANARDARRISDLKQISTALELYNADHNAYPSIITPNNPVIGLSNGKTYMAKVPSNPTPRAEGACAGLEYQYIGSASNYWLVGCLAKASGEVPAGYRLVTKMGAVNTFGPVSGVISGAVRNPGVMTGLVGWWMLDGVNGTKDLSGYGNDGIITGAVVPDIGKYGEADGAYNFSSSSNIAMANQSHYNIGNQMSIFIWTKINPVGYSSNSYFFTRYDSTDDQRAWSLTIENSAGRLGSRISGTGGTTTALFKTTLVDSVYNNTWKHVGYTYNNGVVQVYVEGSPVSATSVTGGTSLKDIFFGSAELRLANSTNFVGLLADARFYNRVLSGAEVEALWLATKP